MFEKHGLEIFHVKEIPSHGGSIRVYCAKKGNYDIQKTVANQLTKERDVVIGTENFKKFQKISNSLEEIPTDDVGKNLVVADYKSSQQFWSSYNPPVTRSPSWSAPPKTFGAAG